MRSEIQDKELQARIFLYHRFGLVGKPLQIQEDTVAIEKLSFEKALLELKRSYKFFLASKEVQEKIYHLISAAFIERNHSITEKESSILIHKISATLMNFYSENYYENLNEHLTKHNLVIVPFNTVENNGIVSHEHVKAMALFDERLLKINPSFIDKNPVIRIYRIQKYSILQMEKFISELRNSMKEPLDYSVLDKTLKTLTRAEKINYILKKDQAVGNGSWLTTKMLVLAIVYVTLLQYCHSKGLGDFGSESLSIQIAEEFYKLFIVDDRNRSIREYLEVFGFQKPIVLQDTLSVTHRLENIKFLLSNVQEKKFILDKIMLQIIYVKSLNWLLSDHLKKGDIGAAYALIEEEVNNRHWNPLIYAAKYGKIVIAELLGSSSRYITQKDIMGNLPIHYAVLNGHLDICQVFVRYKKKNKLNLMAKNQQGNTSLHLAAAHNQPGIIDLLLRNESGLLNMKNDKNESALKLACDHHHVSIIKKLLSKGANLEGILLNDYSDEIQTQLHKAGRPTLE